MLVAAVTQTAPRPFCSAPAAAGRRRMQYSKQALEETCRQALELGKVNYTFIKNTIPVVAEDLGVSGYNTSMNEERNKGAFVMDAGSMDISRLLSRSQSLARGNGKGGDK